MKYDIFVSYSSRDKPVADAVVTALETNGMRCWYAPRDIKPSADWGDSITEAINACKIVILIFSGNSNQSQRVRDEIYYAIAKEKIILPFRIENLDPTGAMSLHLASRHWLDAYQPSWQAHIERLVSSVAAILGNEIPSLPAQEETTAPVFGPAEKEKKRLPWLWIGLAVIFLATLGVVGVLWLGNREGEGGGQPTALVADLQPTTTETILAMDTATPTELPSLASPTQPVPTETQQVIEREVVLNGYFVDDEVILHPQSYYNRISNTLTENLFLNLTNYDLAKAEVVPEAALSWTISPDATLYTFKLRTDIPWVDHPLGGNTTQLTDETGNPRFVTAYDFAYGIKNLCNSRDEMIWDNFFIDLIKGCRAVYEYEDHENIPDELLNNIGVQALSADELLIELEKPASYFLTMTSMIHITALPQWAIEKYGKAWNNPGNIPTNAYYVIDDFSIGERIHLMRNPLLPEDMFGTGNIDKIELAVVKDVNEAYALWLEDEIDFSEIPENNLTTHHVSYPEETIQVFNQAVMFILFQTNRHPFDNVHARRAFAAAFDASAYVNDVLNGQGLPMKHLTPPGIFGAPPIDEIGIGYNLEYAHMELAQAGYPDCQGFSSVTLFVHYSNLPYHTDLDVIIQDWEHNLGCPAGTIILVTPESGDIYEFIDANLTVGGWISDYPDENDWVGFFSCKNSWRTFQRACNEIDDLIEQAAQEVRSSKRIELYAQIEEAFFEKDGEFPIIPVAWLTNFVADHNWLELNHSTMGDTYYNWTVDMDAKLAVKGDE